MTTAVITGITGLRNRGVEALVTTTIAALAARRPDLRVHVLTESPDFDRLRLAHDRVHDVRPVQLTLSSRMRTAVAQRLPFVASRSSRGYHEVRALLEEARVVIASGGDVYSSTYGSSFLRGVMAPLELAREVRTPIVFSAQSIGPFTRADDRDIFLKVARDAVLITARDAISCAYLRNELGLPASRVVLTADPAILLEPSPIGAKKLLASYGIDTACPTIALAPSQAICGWAGADYASHLAALAQVAKLVLDEIGVQLLIVPHVQEIHAELEDRVIATALLRVLDYDPRIRMASGDHTASEYKAMLGACDLVVAERMHAAIAGLSSGVATLCVGYSHKAEGIVDSLMGEGAANSGWVVSIGEFSAAPFAIAAVRRAWARRHEAKGTLSARGPRMRAAAERNFDLVLAAAGLASSVSTGGANTV